MGLLTDWISRSRQATQDRTALESLTNYGNGGFDPTSGYQGGQGAAGGDNGDGSDLTSYAVQRGQQADALRKLIKAYSPDSTDTHTALQAMSVDQLEGLLRGYTMKSASDMQAARMADYQAQAAQRAQMAQDDMSIGAAVNRYANAPVVAAGYDTEPTPGSTGGAGTGASTMREPTADERFRYALATPGLSGRAVPKLIESLTRYGEAGDAPMVIKDNPYPGLSIVTSRTGRGGIHVVEDPNAAGASDALKPNYTEDPVTGARTLLYGKQAITTGFNPAKSGASLTAQHDEDGNLVGWSQTNAKGQAVWIPNKTGAKLKQATDDNGQPVLGFYVDNGGKVIDARSAMQKTLGITPAAPAKASAAGAANKYKTTGDVVADFKKGVLTRAEAAGILNSKFGVPMGK